MMKELRCLEVEEKADLRALLYQIRDELFDAGHDRARLARAGRNADHVRREALERREDYVERWAGFIGAHAFRMATACES